MKLKNMGTICLECLGRAYTTLFCLGSRRVGKVRQHRTTASRAFETIIMFDHQLALQKKVLRKTGRHAKNIPGPSISTAFEHSGRLP